MKNIYLILALTAGMTGQYVFAQTLRITNPITGSAVSGPLNICQGATVQLTSYIPGSSTVSWYRSADNANWTLLAEIAGAEVRYYSVSPTDTYYYKVNNSNSVQVVVLPYPQPAGPLLAGNQSCADVTLSLTTSSQGVSWYSAGDFGGFDLMTGNGNVPLSGNQLVVPGTTVKSYKAVYTSTEGCAASSNSISVGTYGIAPFYSSGTSQDVIFNYPSGNGLRVVKDNCGKLMAQFEGSGVGGFPTFRMLGKVTLGAAVQQYAGRPYLTRHYDFQPVPDGTYPATPLSYRVRLYFTQAEFDAFNAATTAASQKLPTEPIPTGFLPDGSINYGQTNLRVIQAHGIPSVAGGGPETYESAEQLDNPGGCNGGTCDWRIKTYWNANFNVWEVTINNLTSFSAFFITTDNAAPLPVKLVQLDARMAEQSVVINWATSEETNSGSFDIQRSLSGKSWETLGTVAAYGESTGLKRYEFSDQQPVIGSNFYRLRMIDRDGSFAYSRILNVKFRAENEVRVFPNPASEKVAISCSSPMYGFRLVSQTGKVLLESAQNATGRINMPITNIPPGLYVVQILGQNKQITSKKLVVK
jgi:hypothetical protein